MRALEFHRAAHDGSRAAHDGSERLSHVTGHDIRLPQIGVDRREFLARVLGFDPDEHAAPSSASLFE